MVGLAPVVLDRIRHLLFSHTVLERQPGIRPQRATCSRTEPWAGVSTPHNDAVRKRRLR